MTKLTLRLASGDDAKLLWEWANDPETRKFSFSSAPIAWQTHQTWLASKLSNPSYFFRIALDASEVPIGYIRCEKKENRGLISVSVSPLMRREGYGSRIIQLATQVIFKEMNVEMIHAYIKKENQASQKTFEKAGFQYEGIVVLEQHQALQFTYQRNQTL